MRSVGATPTKGEEIMAVDFTNWKHDGVINRYCSSSTCWPIFGRPLRWTRQMHRWLSEVNTTATITFRGEACG